jgi:PEGA domain
MQRTSKSSLTMFTLWVTWLVCVASARADGVSNGSVASSGGLPGLVLINGDASERQRELVSQTIETAVRDAGWSLPSKPLTKSQSDSMVTCFASKPHASCVPPSLQSARVIIVTVENSQAPNGAPMVVLTGRGSMLDPPSTAIEQQYCERCASNDLTAASAALAKIILQDLALRAGTTIVDFRSTPEGAIIVLDGQPIGATNAKFNTYPGKHLARFEKPGYVVEVREFTAIEDKSVLVEAPLRLPDTPPVRAPSKLVPGILLGAGGVLGVTGAVWIYYGTKGDSGDPYRYSRATRLGIGAASLGLGAAAVGAYMLWKGSRSSAPTVTATSGGAVLGWMGTFR